MATLLTILPLTTTRSETNATYRLLTPPPAPINPAQHYFYTIANRPNDQLKPLIIQKIITITPTGTELQITPFNSPAFTLLLEHHQIAPSWTRHFALTPTETAILEWPKSQRPEAPTPYGIIAPKLRLSGIQATAIIKRQTTALRSKYPSTWTATEVTTPIGIGDEITLKEDNASNALTTASLNGWHAFEEDHATAYLQCENVPGQPTYFPFIFLIIPAKLTRLPLGITALIEQHQ